jgi:hypothetical protein
MAGTSPDLPKLRFLQTTKKHAALTLLAIHGAAWARTLSLFATFSVDQNTGPV